MKGIMKTTQPHHLSRVASRKRIKRLTAREADNERIPLSLILQPIIATSTSVKVTLL